jgi:hypothetical protein
MISLFGRTRMTDDGIYGTTCTVCGVRLGLSSDPNILAIVEGAHGCRKWHGRRSGRNSVSQETQRGAGEATIRSE